MARGRGGADRHQGSIGVDLLNALAREMKFRLSPRVTRQDPRKTEVEFRMMGVAFEMQANGEIRLSGALGNEFSPETVLVSASRTAGPRPHRARPVFTA